MSDLRPLVFERGEGCPSWCRGHLRRPTGRELVAHSTDLVHVDRWLEDGGRFPSVYVGGFVAPSVVGPHVMLMRVTEDWQEEDLRVDMPVGEATKLAQIVEGVAPELAAAVRGALALLGEGK